jgi:hypothetical protein
MLFRSPRDRRWAGVIQYAATSQRAQRPYRPPVSQLESAERTRAAASSAASTLHAHCSENRAGTRSGPSPGMSGYRGSRWK